MKRMPKMYAPVTAKLNANTSNAGKHGRVILRSFPRQEVYVEFEAGTGEGEWMPLHEIKHYKG